MGFDIMQTALGQKLNLVNLALYNKVIWVSVFRRPSLKTFILDLVRQDQLFEQGIDCLLYTSPSPRDRTRSRMPSSA